VTKPWDKPSSETIRKTIADNVNLSAAINEISLLAAKSGVDITPILKRYGLNYVGGTTNAGDFGPPHGD